MTREGIMWHNQQQERGAMQGGGVQYRREGLLGPSYLLSAQRVTIHGGAGSVSLLGLSWLRPPGLRSAGGEARGVDGGGEGRMGGRGG